MNGELVKLRAWLDRPWAGISLQVMQETFRGGALVGVAYGEPVVMRTIEPGQQGLHREPLITIGYEEAQVLMDDLWQCGLRPSEGTGSAGALAATQKHLTEISGIAQKLLEHTLRPA